MWVEKVFLSTPRVLFSMREFHFVQLTLFSSIKLHIGVKCKLEWEKLMIRLWHLQMLEKEFSIKVFRKVLIKVLQIECCFMEISHNSITEKMREAHQRSHNTEWNSFTLIQRLIMNWQKENEIFISVSRPQPIRFRSLLIPLSIFSSNSSWDNEIKFSCTLSLERDTMKLSHVSFFSWVY